MTTDSKLGSAIVAIVAADVVLATTTMATVRQLATWHRNEWTVTTFDDLEIPNHKTVIEGNGTKSP